MTEYILVWKETRNPVAQHQRSIQIVHKHLHLQPRSFQFTVTTLFFSRPLYPVVLQLQ